MSINSVRDNDFEQMLMRNQSFSGSRTNVELCNLCDKHGGRGAVRCKSFSALKISDSKLQLVDFKDCVFKSVKFNTVLFDRVGFKKYSQLTNVSFNNLSEAFIKFKECYIDTVNFEGMLSGKLKFKSCRITRLELHKLDIDSEIKTGVSFNKCRISDSDFSKFDIRTLMRNFKVKESSFENCIFPEGFAAEDFTS